MKQIKEFMQIIGAKRFMFLVVLLGFTLLLAGVWKEVMQPQYERANSRKVAVEAERNRLQREIVDLPVRYKELSENEIKYKKILGTGFLTGQDRIVARADMDAIRMRTGVRAISYSIAPQEIVPHPESANAGGDVIRTKISVDMRGLTDLEMRDFIRRMQTGFRGIVVTKTLAFKKDLDPEEDRLRDLTNKKAVDFVSGRIEFEWYTVEMRPVEADPNAPPQQPGMMGGMR